MLYTYDKVVAMSQNIWEEWHEDKYTLPCLWKVYIC